jgi:DNA-directed RNA polymerase specialized sigma24 family protein
MDFITDSPSSGRFPTTLWSRVACAAELDGSQARVALGELCRIYWYPIYAFIRRKGHDPERALDLTQDYFARLLEKRTFAAADPFRGRFRTFLLTDCTFFLADQRDHGAAHKRGGGRAIISIDARDAEGAFLYEPAHGETPERQFERDWAQTLIGNVFERIEKSYREDGRAEWFRCFRPILASDPNALPYAALAVELGMSEGGARVAVHRLRARFAAELREKIASTLESPTVAAVDDELRDLFAALRL